MKSARLLLMTAVLATACDDTPTAIDQAVTPQFSNGAEREVREALYDMTGSTFIFACSPEGEPLPITDGEEVLIEGQVFERIVYKTDGADGVHFTLNTMPVGLRGIGLLSSEEFRVKETERFGASQQLPRNTGSYRQELKMTGTETGRTFWMVFSGSYVIGADGEVKRTRDRERIECKVKN